MAGPPFQRLWLVSGHLSSLYSTGGVHRTPIVQRVMSATAVEAILRFQGTARRKPEEFDRIEAFEVGVFLPDHETAEQPPPSA